MPGQLPNLLLHLSEQLVGIQLVLVLPMLLQFPHTVEVAEVWVRVEVIRVVGRQVMILLVQEVMVTVLLVEEATVLLVGEATALQVEAQAIHLGDRGIHPEVMAFHLGDRVSHTGLLEVLMAVLLARLVQAEEAEEVGTLICMVDLTKND